MEYRNRDQPTGPNMEFAQTSLQLIRREVVWSEYDEAMLNNYGAFEQAMRRKLMHDPEVQSLIDAGRWHRIVTSHDPVRQHHRITCEIWVNPAEYTFHLLKRP